MEAQVSVCVKCGPVSPAANPRLADTCPRCGREMLSPRVTETSRAGEPNTHLERHLHPAGMTWGPYPSAVMARYHAAHVEYGDSWRTRPLASFADEAAEEGLDIGGWLMLLAERVGELPVDAQAEISSLLNELVVDGARVASRARRLSALVRHAGLPPILD